ncbi:hypothetical protein [Propionispora hippei]|uniref:Outer membrane protein beta-barrel domain-containing protein n=1 Tax=Propionispora hippei DSM 15287 TaxID=1123003 RepID=A0A1M6J9B5_9FIRM|nr:hypothetical protein [Propionispora hippei]SHJ43288.1 hypothetical protein SAMN02745170_02536 [Propionispora hippei DSM 15287]
MKKKILTVLAGTMLVAGTAMAAPISDIQEGQTTVGYTHYNLSSNTHDVKDDSFYLESAVSQKFILGIENNSAFPYNGVKATDVYAQYKLDPNVRLIAGNRSYEDGPDKMFYGVGANMALAPKLDGYVSVTNSSIATEWQTGVNYKLDKQTSLTLGYKSYKEDHASTLDGVGFGANYTF